MEPDPPLDRDAAIAKYTPLVWHEAGLSRPWAITRLGTIEDIAQIGFVGLLAAYDTFKRDNGSAKFITYATFVIRRKIREAWLNGGMIRVPHHTQTKLRTAPDSRCRLQKAAKSVRHVSFPGEVLEWHPDRDSSRADCMEDLEDAARIMKGLTPREQKILRLRFAHGLTLREIAGQVGVSKERVRQIVRTSLKSIRERFGVAEPLHADA